MSFSAFVGQAQALDARDAGSQAALRAIETIGRNPVALGIIIASHAFAMPQVLSGAMTLLGDVPMVGFSASAELTSAGRRQHSVVIALLTGSDISAKADLWSGYVEDGRSTVKRMAQAFQVQQATNGLLMLFAEGLEGDARDMLQALPGGEYLLAGGLASAETGQTETFQVGGRQSGSGGLAATLISGKLAVATGMAHGWRPTGLFYTITAANGMHIQELDGRPAIDVFSEVFGYPPKSWLTAPLNQLGRLYPLGIEQSGRKDLQVRSPLRFEADGSLRMHAAPTAGSVAHLLIGSPQSCVQAAGQAAQQALDGLKGAKPVLALVFADMAWQSMFATQPGAETEAIQQVIGGGVPIAGGYTLGQFGRTLPTAEQPATVELFNQHIQVVLFGNTDEER